MRRLDGGLRARRKRKATFRETVGKIVREEGGRSQATMGDAMQLQRAFFIQCGKDPAFLAKGLMLASAHLRRKGKR